MHFNSEEVGAKPHSRMRSRFRRNCSQDAGKTAHTHYGLEYEMGISKGTRNKLTIII